MYFTWPNISKIITSKTRSLYYLCPCVIISFRIWCLLQPGHTAGAPCPGAGPPPHHRPPHPPRSCEQAQELPPQRGRPGSQEGPVSVRCPDPQSHDTQRKLPEAPDPNGLGTSDCSLKSMSESDCLPPATSPHLLTQRQEEMIPSDRHHFTLSYFLFL